MIKGLFLLTYMEITSKILKTSMIQIQGIGYLKTKFWQVKICTHVNGIPLNTSLLYYSVIDKATSNIYQVKKNFIEPYIIKG